MQIQIGDTILTKENIRDILVQAPDIHVDLEITGIRGPFDGKINSIFQVETSNYGDLLIRCRTSKAFRYEPFIKEKVLYPILDGTLDPFSPKCSSQIKTIVENPRGSYAFSSSPAVPVQDLLFWDETLEMLPFPYAIKRMVPGRSLYEIMQEVPEEDLESDIFCDVFRQAGEMLGKLHAIRFPSFFETIDQIGSASALAWPDLYWRQCQKQLAEAKTHANIRPLLPKINKVLREGKELVTQETPVLFHNDYQAQNLIVQGDPREGLQLVGLIDFDNWRIGPAVQDFVKMFYWTIRGRAPLVDLFLQGYSATQNLPDNFRNLLQIYQLLWFCLVFNFETDKIKKAELNAAVDSRFPAAEEYLSAIRSLLAEIS